MSPFSILLGTAQDGGIPHVGCRRSCCLGLDTSRHRLPCSLGIVDSQTAHRWMIDCTPQFPRQLKRLDEHCDAADLQANDITRQLDGILLTHAHIGHYTGLMFLGAEAMSTDRLPVFVMPRMKSFLEREQPWRRLVENRHIELRILADGEPLCLSDRVTITPISVPHRDEFSETVAFIVSGPVHSLLYLPDIDAWEHWTTRIEDVIAQVDVALVDGTFFDSAELPLRNQNSVPHPPISASLQRFSSLPIAERNKIHFFHFNHTNPVLAVGSSAETEITSAGMHIAAELNRFAL